MIRALADRLLDNSVLYDAYQAAIGAPRCHRAFMERAVRASSGMSVLDIGCGVGASLPYLPTGVRYVGFDLSQAYIDTARARFPKAEFHCLDIETVPDTMFSDFDLAFSFGVLHHLPDPVAARALQLAQTATRNVGRFVSLDPCKDPQQGMIDAFLVSNDRGRFVRTVDQYRNLAAPYGKVDYEIQSNNLRVPFTQIQMSVQF